MAWANMTWAGCCLVISVMPWKSNLALLRLMLEGQYRFVINGHTHRRMVRSFDHLTIINAGTLYRQHEPCFLLADFEAGFVQFYDFKSHTAVSKGELFQLPHH
jgi:predicted phosphodiesterase